MTIAQAKSKAIIHNDNGEWWELLKLFIIFGTELIKFIREYRKNKKSVTN